MIIIMDGAPQFDMFSPIRLHFAPQAQKNAKNNEDRCRTPYNDLGDAR